MSQIPCYSASTYNCRSLGAYHPTAARSAKASNIYTLSSKNHITCIQDTHLHYNEDKYLGSTSCPLPLRHVAFYSNGHMDEGHVSRNGVATIVSDHLHELYYIEKVPLPKALDGRALTLLFRPKGGGSPFSFTNLYLQAGAKPGIRAAQVRLLKGHIPVMDFMFFAGDFNFVENKFEDTASHATYYDPSGEFQKDWAGFLSHFNLREIHQPTHTYINHAQSTSSRLDRFYVSYTEADWGAKEPYTYIHTIPHTILTDHLTNTDTYTYDTHNDVTGSHRGLASDHFPVGLAFDHERIKESRGARLPAWVASDPLFLTFFEDHWYNLAYTHRNMSSFKLLSIYKQCLYAAGRDVHKERARKTTKYGSDLAELIATFKTINIKDRDCATTHLDPSDTVFLNKHPSLSGLSVDQLRAKANGLLKEGGVERQASDVGAPSLRRAHNPISSLKLLLPSTRKRLHALRPSMDVDPTSDPGSMAQIAASFWKRIWAQRLDDEERIEPEAYFGDYIRTIPPHLTPKIPSVKDLEKAILASNNSSPGTDGIPFVAYRATVSHAAPILKLVLNDLSAGVLPPDGYNDGLLFLIPKKGTLLPSDTRPISVTNADNRIIAKAVVGAITPALCHVLHGSQKGFIEGRIFEEHIRELNEQFYTVVEEGGGGATTSTSFLWTPLRPLTRLITHLFLRRSDGLDCHSGSRGWLLACSTLLRSAPLSGAPLISGFTFVEGSSKAVPSPLSSLSSVMMFSSAALMLFRGLKPGPAPTTSPFRPSSISCSGSRCAWSTFFVTLPALVLMSLRLISSPPSSPPLWLRPSLAAPGPKSKRPRRLSI